MARQGRVRLIRPGTWYQVINKRSGRALDVQGESKRQSAKVITWAVSSTPKPNQLFQFFELDDGRHAIAAMHSGLVLDVERESRGTWDNNPKDPNDQIVHLVQFPFSGGDNQKFAVEDGGDGWVYFIARHSGLVLSEFELKVGRRVGQRRFADGLEEQLWKLKPSGQVVVPKLPTCAPLQDLPQLRKSEAPDTYPTKMVTTHAARVPCICVANDDLPMVQRLQKSPFYLMVRKQHWRLIASRTLQDEETFTGKHTWSDDRSREFNAKVGIKVGADLGFKFQLISAGIKNELSAELGVKTSESIKTSTSEEYTKKLKPRVPGANWFLYVRCSRFELVRPDQKKAVATTDELEDWNNTRELQYPSGSLYNRRLKRRLGQPAKHPRRATKTRRRSSQTRSGRPA